MSQRNSECGGGEKKGAEPAPASSETMGLAFVGGFEGGFEAGFEPEQPIVATMITRAPVARMAPTSRAT